MRTALVCGAGGFIGSHLVKRLKRESFWVRGVDLKYPEFSETVADDFVIDGDRRQAAENPSHPRTARRAQAHFEQRLDRRKARLGAERASGGWLTDPLPLDREPSARQRALIRLSFSPARASPAAR